MSVTPRVNAHYLPSFVNQTVRLVGRVQSVDPSGALQLATSDHGAVSVFSQNLASGEGAYDANIYSVGAVVEMVGLVQEDGTLMEYIGIALGKDFGQSQTATRPSAPRGPLPRAEPMCYRCAV